MAGCVSDQLVEVEVEMKKAQVGEEVVKHTVANMTEQVSIKM